MAFVFCDEHDIDVEADGIDVETAKSLILIGDKKSPSPAEKELIEFGQGHRHCSIRILPG